MSSSENDADPIDTITPRSGTPHISSTGELTGAPSTEYESTRESYHSNMTRGNPTSTSINNIIDKQVEIVETLNDHSTLLVDIILLAAVIFVAWALYEMGYLGNKYTPTKCIGDSSMGV
jgi:hypothetical protein